MWLIQKLNVSSLGFVYEVYQKCTCGYRSPKDAQHDRLGEYTSDMCRKHQQLEVIQGTKSLSADIT